MKYFVPTKEEEEEEAQTRLLYFSCKNYYKFIILCNVYDTKFSKYNRTSFFFFFFFFTHEIVVSSIGVENEKI